MIKEIVIQVRPSVEIAWPEEALGSQAQDNENYLQNQYYATNKIVKSPPSTSSDGLTKTYEYVFSNMESVTEFYNDATIQAYKQVRNNYMDANGIVASYTQEGFVRPI